MQWMDAIKLIVEERVKEIEADKGKKQTKLAEESPDLTRNFFTRLFNNKVKRLDLDQELEPLAKLLGFSDAFELLLAARQKKTLSSQ